VRYEEHLGSVLGYAVADRPFREEAVGGATVPAFSFLAEKWGWVMPKQTEQKGQSDMAKRGGVLDGGKGRESEGGRYGGGSILPHTYEVVE
jgi:hypothetical protein